MSDNGEKSVKVTEATYVAVTMVKAIEQRPVLDILEAAVYEYVKREHPEVAELLTGSFTRTDEAE